MACMGLLTDVSIDQPFRTQVLQPGNLKRIGNGPFCSFYEIGRQECLGAEPGQDVALSQDVHGR